MSNTATWTELIAWELTAKNAEADLERLRVAARAVVDCEHFGEWGHRLDALRDVVKETEKKWRKP
jgi:hypothetical protein